MTHINRRHFLNGTVALGANYFLPFVQRLRAQTSESRIKRIILFYVPNGTQYMDWKPTSYGTNFGLSKILQPLARFKDQTLVFDRMSMKIESEPENEHQRGLGALWTNQGLNNGSGGSGFAKGISIDQAIANYLASNPNTRTPVHSLNLTIFEGDNNQSYQSFRGNNQPVIPIYNPKEAYDLAFSGASSGGSSEEQERARQQQTAVVDYLKRDLNDLKRNLNAKEKAKLEEHLDGLRTIERGLNTDAPACRIPSAPADKPSTRIASEAEFRAVGKAHMDIIVEAFSCDRTRVASLMWDQCAGDGTFEFLAGIDRPDGYRMTRSAEDNNYNHHDHSHQYIEKKNPDVQRRARESLTLIHEWYMKQLAYLVERLAERNLLDDTLIVSASDIATGVHSMESIPFVLVGGSNYLKTGQAIDFKGGYHGPLLTTIAQGFGQNINRFGSLDQTPGVIPEILRGGS